MPKRKQTKHEDDILRNIRQPDRYDPKARSFGGPWRMVKCKDGAYVCYEQHMEIIDNLRKNAEINDAQSPHDGIHTCSKGCKKPGCNRGLRDTIEEQDAQIVALKQDLLEKAAELRRLHQERVHDLNQIGGLQEEVARLTEAGNGVFWMLSKFTDADNANRACKAWLKARNQGAVKELRSLFANSEWQSIETAPTDGTEFLGYSERCGICCVHYGMNDDGEGWMLWAGHCTQLVDVPTHWMPLPDFPTK